jgi:mono/diheme cytochrome c family protein
MLESLEDHAMIRRVSGLAVVTMWCVAAVPAVAQDARVERGQKLYVSEKCGVCHSIAGKGNVRGALDDVGTRLTAEELRLWLVAAEEMTAKTKSTRKPLMRSYPKLAKDDVDALVAYMQTLKK